MANIPESPLFDADIYQIETTDKVLGGPDGVVNLQAKQLANRTAYLKQEVEAAGETAGAAEVKADSALSRIASAETAMGNAAASAAEANQYKQDALAAKALAEQARSNSQAGAAAAASSAQYAAADRQLAQQAASGAQANATASVQAYTQVASARDVALAAKDAAVVARGEAETFAGQADADRVAAEAAATAAAGSALAAAGDADDADAARVAAEAARDALFNDLASSEAGKGSERVAFKQAGTGAVARTVAAKLKEWVSVKDFGAIGDGIADDTAAIQAALDTGKSVFVPAGTYIVSNTLYTRSNGVRVFGENGKTYGGTGGTILRPSFTTDGKAVLDVFNGAGASSGQLVTIEDIAFFGTQDFVAAAVAGSPITTGPVGIYAGDGSTGNNTKDSFEIRRCTFKRLKKAFTLKGWIHYVDDCYINNCASAFDITSTNSSTVSKTVIQTCTQHWGALSGVTVKDSTIQQGSERPVLEDDKGFTCSEMVVFDNCYFEGGNKHVVQTADANTTLINCILGFTQLKAGGGGHVNLEANTNSKLFVRGGKKIGTSTIFVTNGNIANTVWIDLADPLPSSVWVGAYTNIVNCPNYRVVRSYGTHTRTNWHNIIEFARVVLADGNAKRLFNLEAATSKQHAGNVRIHAAMASTFDFYNVSFATESAIAVPLSTINTLHRNTSGSGTNNITLAVDGTYNLTATRNKAVNCDINFSVESYGATYLVDPGTL